tara:strand:- start:2172 stop:3389 length:1218 start_codon:yes stop_codon:yes gene_type:complete
MRILFLSDNFYPEVNAPASRTYENSKVWVKQGYSVTVITCFPNFPGGVLYRGYSNKLYSVEYIDGIRVIRVWSYITANKGFFRRILDYLSFFLSSFIAGLFVKCDIIIATSPQFFTSISGFLLSKIKFKPWVMEVRDLWPDSIIAVGYLSRSNIIYKFLKIIENKLYRSSNVIISLTQSFKQKFIYGHNINSKKIGVFTNGIDRSSISFNYQKINKIKDDLDLNGKIIITYIGTIGMAHGLKFIVETIIKMNNSSIVFVFVGDGSEKEILVKKVKKSGVGNILFINSLPKTEIYNYIKLSDLALVNLKKNDEFKNVIPSKIFENVALKIPILLGVEGEAQELIENYGVGVAFKPESEREFIASIDKALELKLDINYENNCERMIEDFDRKKIAERMIKFIEKNYK